MDQEVSLPVAGEVIAAIAVALPGLVPSDKKVAQFILSDPERVLDMPVVEFAELAGIAPSTVVHACKQLGFKGFQDLRLALARDLGRRHKLSRSPLPAKPGPAQILHSVVESSARTLMAGLRTVDTDAFAQAIALLSMAPRILVIGGGTSRAAADDIAYRLNLIGRDAAAPADVLAQHQAARRLTSKDALLAVSYSGASRGTIESVDIALEQNAKVVAITSRTTSPLTQRATVALVAGAPEEDFRLGVMNSRLAHLALAAAIYTALAYADERRALDALQATDAIDERHTL
ncbi:MurR/RpiR family transcriptional regulator [Nocardia sp. NPDC004711]